MMTTHGERERLQAAFDASNAIADLDGLPFTDAMREMQARIIAGELTFDEAVVERIASITLK